MNWVMWSKKHGYCFRKLCENEPHAHWMNHFRIERKIRHVKVKISLYSSIWLLLWDNRHLYRLLWLALVSNDGTVDSNRPLSMSWTRATIDSPYISILAIVFTEQVLRHLVQHSPYKDEHFALHARLNRGSLIASLGLWTILRDICQQWAHHLRFFGVFLARFHDADEFFLSFLSLNFLFDCKRANKKSKCHSIHVLHSVSLNFFLHEVLTFFLLFYLMRSFNSPIT